MKRSIQIMIVGIILILGGSTLLQTGYAQTSDQITTSGSTPDQTEPILNQNVRQTQPEQTGIQLKIQDAAQTDQTGDSEPLRTVSVSGQGQVDAQPDVAVVRMGVQTEAESAEQALRDNSSRMQALLDALRNAGISSEDIQTQTVQLQPRYEDQPQQQGQGATRTLAGYVATNTVQVRARDLDNLGTLLDAAVEAGGNTIEGIRFEVSDTTGLLDQAREAAMNDARHKAEQLASLAGASLGDVLTINESGVPRPTAARETVALSQAQAVPIEPGTQSIDVSIQVTWLLQ